MKNIVIIASAIILASCGGKNTASSLNTPVNSATTPYATLAAKCAAPRPAGTINPDTGTAYGDSQGNLGNEMAWIAAFVNETYLWYPDVPVVNSSTYFIGATVPYVSPSNNASSTKTVTSNYQVVDAYFNSQRSGLTTASGKPKDQFHFTYLTTDWQSLSTAGVQAGFGFDVALLAASPPRKAVIALTSPNTPASTNSLQRGAQFLTVNGIDLVNDNTSAGIAVLNEGLFSPISGTSYTFTVLDQGSVTPRTVTMTAAAITLTPVQNVGTLPAPNANVGYMLYNDQIATAESELIAAVNQLKSAGITDLVLDMRYNGGGYLDLASELSYMIATPAATTGTVFEKDNYNSKNPFNLTTAQVTVPFHNVTQGFSTTSGQPLPQLGLSKVYVLTGSGTCSASEAIMNGLLGVGVKVIQIGATTCGKPYGFFPQDNCSTTYFTIQFDGVNNAGFGAYADGFIPAGTGTTANNLPGCAVADDFTKQLGDPTEGLLAAALQYRTNGTCPAPIAMAGSPVVRLQREPILNRSPARENRILRRANVSQ